jgi:gamma-glutamyltranspeptidase/glutathione hydrolase
MNFMRRGIVFLFFLAFAYPVAAAGPASPPAAAVAAAHPLATQAAFEILRDGGNAFDAAVTAAAVLAVVEPYGSGLGGGGFFLLHRAKDGFETMIDARERAPLVSRPAMYLDRDGNILPRASLDGPKAAAIPGTPAALAHLAAKYGRLPLGKTLAPAIRLARHGFTVTPSFQKMARLRQGALLASGEASLLFLDDGLPPRAGHVIRQGELADTLAGFAQRGHDGFYKGDTARRLVDGVRAAGGEWTLADLAGYRVVEREPVRGLYRGMRVTAASLPSSGGLLLVKMLRTLEDTDLAKLGTAGRSRAIVESMRAAYRERVMLGDPDFVAVDTSRFLGRPGAGLTKGLLRTGETREAGANTTHFSILDREGNRVAATLSLNLPFGSGFVAPGTGVLLNNQMDDFAIKPGAANVYGLTGSAANAIAPGKRPLSSMTPAFLETGDAVAILGTPGGSRIPSMMLLAALEFARGDRSPRRLVSLPRYHHQDSPDRLDYESDALDAETRFALDGWGYKLEPRADGYGNMQAVMWEKRAGRVQAASDPRGEGSARVEE